MVLVMLMAFFELLSLVASEVIPTATATATSTATTTSAPSTTEPSYLRSEWATPGSPWANLSTTIESTFHPNGEAVNITGLTHDGLAIYLGIPFAQPPLGDLRFERPQPANYTAHVDATKAPNACLQRTKTGSSDGIGTSEDCLQLNILTPVEMVECDDKEPLPVMVWMWEDIEPADDSYGGGFYAGSATLYTSPEFVKFSKQIPVVLVTIAYRVGIFGFPQGAEMAAHGATNLGLRDQILALQWVRDNIASFGGDPSAVTVYGESAGAVSISLLMLNETQDLFRAAIMESGAASTLPFGVAGHVYQKPYDLLVQNAGCNGTADSVACLKTLTGEDLIAAQLKMLDSDFALAWGYPFGTAIDGDLIPASPFHMLKNGTFARIPFISGCNKDEGTEFLPASISKNLTDLPLSFGLNLMFPAPLEDSFLQVIERFYPRVASLGAPFGTGDDLFGGLVTPAWKQVTGVLTDLAFQSRRRWFLRQANTHGFNQTWSYEFNATNPKDLDYMGCSHEAEKPYVMARATAAANYTSDQVALGRDIMEYWLNFAYYSDPNGQDCDMPNWRPHNFPSDKNSLQLATANITVIQDDFREERIAIFNQPENAYFVKRSFTL